MQDDYVNGIDLNKAYDVFDTDPGTGCAVWYNADGEIDWEEFNRNFEEQKSAALALAAKIEADPTSSILEIMGYIGCGCATIGIVLVGMKYKKNAIDPEEEDEYERI